MINLEKLVEFTSPFFAKGLADFDKSLVLLLGHTGAGKSTTVNYLLGHEFVMGEGGIAEPADPLIELPAYAADTSASVTSYPKAFPVSSPTKEKQLALCDCPGLADSRGIEARVGISLCLDAVLEKAREVWALTVVIDYASILSSRASPFRALIASIGRIISEPKECASSLFFIFNRLPRGVSKASLRAKLTEILNIEKEALEQKKTAPLPVEKLALSSLKVDADIENLQGSIAILETMLETYDKSVIFIDIFDSGASREILLTKLSEARPIPKAQLSFSALESSKREYDEVLLANLREYQQAIDHTKQSAVELLNTKAALSICEADLAQLITQLKTLQANPPTFKDPSLTPIHEEIARMDEKLVETQNHLAATEKLLFTYEQELSNLDVSTSVHYKNLEKHYDIDGFLGNDTVYVYNDVPFVEISASNYTGTYKHKEYYPSRGQYRGKYKRGYSDKNYAYPTVAVWVEKRVRPDNKRKIDELRDRTIPHTQAQIATTKREINQLKTKLADLRKELNTQHNANLLRHAESIQRTSIKQSEIESKKQGIVAKKEETITYLHQLLETRKSKSEQLRPLVTIITYGDIKNKELFFLTLNFILDLLKIKKIATGKLVFPPTEVPAAVEKNTSNSIRNLILQLSQYDKVCKEHRKQIYTLEDLASSLPQHLMTIQLVSEKIQAQELIKPTLNDQVFLPIHTQIRELEELLSSRLRTPVLEAEAELATYRSALSLIDVETPVPYLILKDREAETVRNFFGNDTIYRYNGIPFCHVSAENYSGRYKHKESDPSKGTYRGKYKRGIFDKNRSYPTVTVWVEKRHHPDNQNAIRGLKNDLIPKAEEALKIRKREMAQCTVKILQLKKGLDAQFKESVAKYTTILDGYMSTKANEENSVRDIYYQQQQISKEVQELLRAKSNLQQILYPLLGSVQEADLEDNDLFLLAKTFVIDAASVDKDLLDERPVPSAQQHQNSKPALPQENWALRF